MTTVTTMMETLSIKTENKFRTLVTKRAYKKGEIICIMPSENITDKPIFASLCKSGVTSIRMSANSQR